jgi:hypothetical protein
MRSMLALHRSFLHCLKLLGEFKPRFFANSGEIGWQKHAKTPTRREKLESSSTRGKSARGSTDITCYGRFALYMKPLVLRFVAISGVSCIKLLHITSNNPNPQSLPTSQTLNRTIFCNIEKIVGTLRVWDVYVWMDDGCLRTPLNWISTKPSPYGRPSLTRQKPSVSCLFLDVLKLGGVKMGGSEMS